MDSSAPRAQPRRRTELLLFALAIVFILAVSVALTLRREDVASTPEPKRFSGSRVVLPMPSLLASGRLDGRVRVAVVRDEAAAGYYDSKSTLDSVVGAWRDALATAGAEVRVVRSAELAAAPRWARVIVVPSSPCLTVATREAMDAAGARGQGLIVTGAAGALDAACRRIGYGLVVSLTAASRVAPLETRPMVYVTLGNGSPLTADIPPGARLDLKPAGQLALRHPARDAFYSDYSLLPAPVEGQPLLDGAVSHGVYGTSRVVYWGFELRDAVARPWNEAVLALLVRNSVRWAAGLPSVTIETWPDGKRAAAVLAQDVEDHFGNARNALDSLRAADVRGTFFLTSDLALRNPRLSRRLSREGEIGTHSENHRLLGGTPPDAQRVRLEKTQRDLTDLLGHPVLGLRPPQEQFDDATMVGWLTAGGSYLLGANDSRTVGPELLRIGTDTLVLLSRNGGDDFTAVRDGRRDPRATADIFLREYQRIRALGGLYILSYHSQLLSTPEMVPALALVARELAADSAVWSATAGAAAAWWRSRASLDVRLVERGAGRMDVVVENRGSEPVLGAVADVALASPRRVLRTSTAMLPSEPGTVRVRLPPLPPRATRGVTITFVAPVAPRRSTHSAAISTRRHKRAPMKAGRQGPWWAPWRW
jgi:peptidoglycan/xylan/chitin deacetylase (PgdA/CDA1 family)